MKKALFIDRDGTLVIEPPVDYQLDSFHKLEFYPKVFRNLGFIRSKLTYVPDSSYPLLLNYGENAELVLFR